MQFKSGFFIKIQSIDIISKSEGYSISPFKNPAATTLAAEHK